MKAFISEYGTAIYYGIISMLCLIIFIGSSYLAVNVAPVKVKTSTYNSKVAYINEMPVITIKNNCILKANDNDVSKLNTEGISYLISNGIVNIKNANSSYLKVDGNGNAITPTSNSSYTVTIVAKNQNGTVYKDLTIFYANKNHLFF